MLRNLFRFSEFKRFLYLPNFFIKVFFSVLLLPVYLRSKYFPRHFVFSHPQFMSSGNFVTITKVKNMVLNV